MALYIDVEPVFKQLTATVVTDDTIGLGVQMGLNRAMEILAKAPIVESEPVVHAQWEFKYIQQIAPSCSNCGMQSLMAYPNCPYCRAKMENGR